MSKKIMGVTVGTSLSPSKIEEKIKPIKTVNNVAPDENGNVEFKIPEGANGKTPYIKNGNWWIGETDTEVKAEGTDGVGILKIEKTATNGNLDTYTITYTNGNTSTFTVSNGADGFSPTVSVEAIDGGHRVVITDKNGEKKVNILDGADGRGISSVLKTSTNGFVDTYTITFTDNTTATFTVTNGKAGTSVTVSSVSESTADGGSNVVTFSDGKTLTVKNGKNGADGKTPYIKNKTWWIGDIDTGIKAEGADGKDYVLTASDKIEIAEKAVELIEDMPDYVKTEAESVIDRVLSAQGNRTFTFAVMTDMHYGNGSYTDGIKHACQAIKYIDERVKLDTIAILGDYTDGYPSTNITDAMADFKGINAMLDKLRFAPNLRQMGNHDYYADNIPMTRRLIQYYSDDVVWGSKTGGYFHKDYEDIKLRIICLNTNEINPMDTSNNHPSSSISITVDQCNWFINTLDMSSKEDVEDWQILILSHQPLDWWTYDNANRLTYIVNAYQKGASWTDSTISCNFNGKNKAKLVGNIHGHIHNLLHEPMFLGVANNGTKTTVYRWATPNACYNRENQYDGVWQEPTTYSKTRNSAKDTSFVVYCLDLETYTMKAICYGAGYDRETTYAEVISFTNAIPLSINSDSSPYNGGQGWKTNTRLNSSGAEAELTNWEATGFIPITGTSKIYFKNIDWNSDGAGKDYLAIYDSSFAKIASEPFTNWVNTNGADLISSGKIQKDANGNITYLDVSGLETANFGGAGFDFGSRVAYFRLSACGITNDSIISIDNPIE